MTSIDQNNSFDRDACTEQHANTTHAALSDTRSLREPEQNQTREILTLNVDKLVNKNRAVDRVKRLLELWAADQSKLTCTIRKKTLFTHTLSELSNLFTSANFSHYFRTIKFVHRFEHKFYKFAQIYTNFINLHKLALILKYSKFRYKYHIHIFFLFFSIFALVAF